jgi:hypothetical protein
MDSIYAWLQVENQNIEEDPSFLIEGVPAARETLPWQTLTINAANDTARYQYDRAHPDITTAFNVYAHLHLMKRLGRLAEWMPEHANADGYALERAIVGRLADAWLLGRAVFDAPAYQPLDELIYAQDAGYLDAYLLTARPTEFAAERAAWESHVEVDAPRAREPLVGGVPAEHREPAHLQNRRAAVGRGRSQARALERADRGCLSGLEAQADDAAAVRRVHRVEDAEGGLAGAGGGGHAVR